MITDQPAISHVMTHHAGRESSRAQAAAVQDGFEDIHLPKNTGAGFGVGVAAFLVGFGVIWQMYWLTLIAAIALAISVAIRTTMTDDSEHVITAESIATVELVGRAQVEQVA